MDDMCICGLSVYRLFLSCGFNGGLACIIFISMGELLSCGKGCYYQGGKGLVIFCWMK